MVLLCTISDLYNRLNMLIQHERLGSLTVTFRRSMKERLFDCFCMATNFSIISCCSGAKGGISAAGLGADMVEL